MLVVGRVGRCKEKSRVSVAVLFLENVEEKSKPTSDICKVSG